MRRMKRRRMNRKKRLLESLEGFRLSKVRQEHEKLQWPWEEERTHQTFDYC
jgi:hypothetical protein